MRLGKLKIILIFIWIGCQNNQLDNKLPNINYHDNLVNGSIEINDSGFRSILKNYNLEIIHAYQNELFPIYSFEEIVAFKMLKISGKNYFSPIWFTEGSGFQSKFFYNKIWKVYLNKNEQNEIEIEIEFCLRIVDKDEFTEYGNFIIGEKIDKALIQLIQSEKKKITLSNEIPKAYDEINRVCRKFKIVQNGHNVIIQKRGFKKEIIPEKLIDFGTLEIKESGNILDTLFINPKMWEME